MSQVGRISGPLLTANLERNGIDLAFRDTLSTTQLLYLDVTNGRIGVNKSAPMYELDVNGTTQTTDLISTTSNIALLQFTTNNINALVGDINIKAPEIINISSLGTDNLNLDDNKISSYRSNSNIDLVPNGTGRVIVGADDSAGDLALNVQGNLHATGNITYEGNITFGDNINQDTVTFDADIKSDIIPDVDGSFTLGNANKKWLSIEAQSMFGEITLSGDVIADGVKLSLRQGNVFYVSENGDDTNVGDHPNGPFKTLKHALSVSDASIQGPVTIYVYPGGYEEELPLVVPSNVSVIGVDMRNTIIRPTSADQSKDIFHLNGESTVQNLTIKDFYYDSLNDTGYAFRFAPNTVVTTRSPYVQNITVITQGTTTSASDPRGFASGDAGKGALVDGADVLSASEEASMLFHSVTFITPGVDAVTMTNGVRVEWLNSFTYFANRGLYAVDGVTGHLSTDGSTVKYGAELRSIGSASVYGNYGAVADGADCLMYLIQHNMAYIGLGKYVDNDPSRVIQTQEITELNSGRIFYQSIDHLGNFRVGNDFFIDQEAGETTLTLTEADIDSLAGLTITTNGNITIVNGDRVETGNIRFDDNQILSTLGAVNFSSSNGNINLQTNTNIAKDLDISGNLSFDGNLNLLGNQATDIIDFNVNFDQDINPHQDGKFSLGTPVKRWLTTNSNTGYFGDTKFSNNYFTTDVSNADLELRASGAGEVIISSNNFTISNNLTVDGLTDLQDLNINGLTLNNDLTISSNYSTTNLTVENLTVGSQVQFEEIKFDGNYISTTSTNADLELRAAGTGNILIPNDDVTISNNTDIQSTWYSADMNVATQVVATEFDDNTINIKTNYITTDISNADLDLRASGSGNILISDSASITNNLTVNTITSLQDTNINGTTTVVGNINQTGNYNQTGNFIISQDLNVGAAAQYEEILFDDNYITTTSTNQDLELRASGTGEVIIPNNNVQINNDLSLGTLNANTINIDNEFELENMVSSTDIEIFDNVITTTNSNSNLELRTAGSGSVYLQQVEITGNSLSTKANIDSTLTDLVFDTDNIDLDTNTAFELAAGTTAERNNTQGDIRFNTDDNVFEGYNTSTITFNTGVYSSDRLTSVTADDYSNNLRFIVNGSDDPIDSTKLVGEIAGDTLTIHGIQVDDINIQQNVIGTNVTNSDLELVANGTGSVIVDNINVEGSTFTNTQADAVFTFASTDQGYARFAGDGAVLIPTGPESSRPVTPEIGQTRINTDLNIMETWTGTEWRNSAGEFDAVSEEEMDDISLIQTLIYG